MREERVAYRDRTTKGGGNEDFDIIRRHRFLDATRWSEGVDQLIIVDYQ